MLDGVILVLMFGIMSLIGLPIQLTPDVNRPVIQVRTVWPGASPTEMEREVTNALDKATEVRPEEIADLRREVLETIQ
ncbi:MAG: efflux RND transporter permease subunit, partial [Poseidonia sp.]